MVILITGKDVIFGSALDPYSQTQKCTKIYLETAAKIFDDLRYIGMSLFYRDLISVHLI